MGQQVTAGPFLHVPTHKEQLKKNGVLYAGLGKADYSMFAYFYDNYTDPQHFLGVSPEEAKAKAEARMVEIEKEIRESDAETVIYSNEHLCLFGKEKLERVREYFSAFGKVEVIYFYREILDWMASDTSQLAKSGLSTRVTPYERAMKRMYDIPLMMSAIFADVQFFHFSEAVRDGLFLKACGVSEQVRSGVVEERANPSISDAGVRTFFIYNRLFPRGSGNRSKEMSKKIASLPGGKYKVSGLRRDQIEDYEAKRIDIAKRLNFRLVPGSTIPESDIPDPQNFLVQRMLRAQD